MTIKVKYDSEQSKVIKITYDTTPVYISTSVSAVYIKIAGIDESGVYVPYNGATKDVNLGEYSLNAGQIQFDLTPTGTAAIGVTRWNPTVGTIETTLRGGSVVIRHGRDMFETVVNKTGVQLTKASYQAVRVSNAQGQRLAVALAQANNDNNSADTIGLAVETIDVNQEGIIFTVGELNNINSTGSLQGETWVDGDVLYLSPTTAGKITNVKPVAPQHLVVIGYVVYAHQNNGKIFIKIMNGWEIGELHDVKTQNTLSNQTIKYNSSLGIFENKSIVDLSSVPATAASTGVAGDLRSDGSYLYVCTAANTWKRTQLSSW